MCVLLLISFFLSLPSITSLSLLADAWKSSQKKILIEKYLHYFSSNINIPKDLDCDNRFELMFLCSGFKSNPLC